MWPEKRKVFVTGGTGLVGSHLLYSLAESRSRIRAGYRNAAKLESVRNVFGYYSGKADDLFNSIEWVASDLSDLTSLKGLIKGSGHVYHCAGAISFDSTGSKDLIRNNTQITSNIIRACLESGTEKLCHVSSSSALGSTRSEMAINESHLWSDSESHSPYAVSKYLSEAEVWKGIRQGLKAVIVNPVIILGPGNWNNGSLLFFPRIAGGGMRFYTSGVTGYVDVRDVVKAMVILMNSPAAGERYIISSENLTFRELFSMMAENLNVRKPFIPVPGFLSQPAGYILKAASVITGKQGSVTPDNIRSAFSRKYFDNSKIIMATGMEFIPVRKSIEDTCLIFRRENPD